MWMFFFHYEGPTGRDAMEYIGLEAQRKEKMSLYCFGAVGSQISRRETAQFQAQWVSCGVLSGLCSESFGKCLSCQMLPSLCFTRQAVYCLSQRTTSRQNQSGKVCLQQSWLSSLDPFLCRKPSCCPNENNKITLAIFVLLLTSEGFLFQNKCC